MPLLAASVAIIPLPRAAAWPVTAGLGGSIGQIILKAELGAGHAVLGLVGAAFVWLLSAAIAIVLGTLALGLSRSEWRIAGRAAGVAARASVAGGIGAIGAISRGAGGAATASGWLVNLVNRGPGLAPEAPPPVRPVRPPPVVRQERVPATKIDADAEPCHARRPAGAQPESRAAGTQAAAAQPVAARGWLDISFARPAERAAGPRRCRSQ